MKKFFIPLVLLCGFIIFVPQMVLGATNPPNWDKFYSKAEDAYSSGCWKNFKSKLPKKHKATYLNVYRGWPDMYMFEEFTTENEYFVYTNYNEHDDMFHNDVAIPYYYKIKSTVFDCDTELISINMKYKKAHNVYHFGFVNVKNVSPGSFLKLVSPDLEVKVIPPTNKEYKNLMAKYNEISRKENEKINKRNATINCFKERKEKLSQEYKGPNLTFFHVNNNKEFPLHLYTKYNYYVDGLYNLHNLKLESIVLDCDTEIIAIYHVSQEGKVDFSKIEGEVNVIDVFPGSTLKYIPETKEFQVLPPKK